MKFVALQRGKLIPGYAEAVRKASGAAIEVMEVQAKETPEEITFSRMLPVC